MSSPRVYLAGPITGLTYDQGQDWRKRTTLKLGKDGIDAYSPLRGKSYLREQGVLDKSHYEWDEVGGLMSTSSAIVARDRNDCMKSDVVLVNLLGAQRVSIGSVMEVAWADAGRIPIILVIEPDGNPHDHAMLIETAGWTVHEIEDALSVVRCILLPAP